MTLVVAILSATRWKQLNCRVAAPPVDPNPADVAPVVQAAVLRPVPPVHGGPAGHAFRVRQV
ncbi:MAG: hypothetical protein ACK553_01370, partial [Planctomycetota bacterium]